MTQLARDKYRNTRRLTWFINLGIMTLLFACLFHLGADAVPVLSVGLPAMVGQTAVFTHVANRNSEGE